MHKILKKKKFLGPALIIFFSVWPFFLWANIMPLSLRFGGWIQFFVSLGQIFALVGTAMFAISLVLSTRLKIFEDYFGGMNKVYIVHHFLGGLSFVLLLLHPLFLLARTLPVSVSAAAAFLLPEGNLAKDLGAYSLLFIIILLIITFFGTKLKYETWKKTHKLLGFVFFLGAFHSFLIGSDMVISVPLKFYMISISLLGVSAYFYKTILGRFYVKTYRYKIIKKNELNKDVIELTFEAVDEVMPYRPGQFVFIKINSKFLPNEAHPFSISSGNMGNKFSVAIKRLGDYTYAMQNVEEGEFAQVEGAYGRFFYENVKNKNQIWIAGGIGITPFMGLARKLVSDSDGYRADLFYCTRNKDEQFFSRELNEYSNNYDNFNLIPHYSKDYGWINAGFVKSKCGDLKNKDIFICGPPSMINLLRQQFKGMGIANGKIHAEEFKLN